ncbi:MAG: hypothetical protein QMD01_02865 [Thermodesulfovibrionales bacterium]|nr:hypothetical protein [Thermodesulfovibrionales bacterium]
MKSRFVLTFLVYALPLILVIILALYGIVWEFQVYLILAILHLVVVSGILWYLYKDMENKITDTQREHEKE